MTTRSSGDDPEKVSSTAYTYDLAGRQLSAKGEGDASTSVYNASGWVLSAKDADGIETTTTFDPAGRETTSSTAGDCVAILPCQGCAFTSGADT